MRQSEAGRSVLRHKRLVCVFTGSRAEYSAVYNLIREVTNSSQADLHLLVAACHWAPEFGLTFREIVRDGFHIDSKIEMVLSSDSDVGVVKSMGVGLMAFADLFDNLRPDVLVVAGDRFEALAVSQAAYVLGIPVAHIGGGEVTGGSLDEGFRHAITKLAKLHFVASEECARRVRQLGERPESIFVVGPPALEDLLNLEPESLEDLSSELGMELHPSGFVLCTYHADGTSSSDSAALQGMLRALDANPHLQVIFTSSNADANGREVTRQVQDWCDRNPERGVFVSSLGRRRYHSLLRFACFVLGNSSSGLIEAPAAGVPTVNIGDRQAGRTTHPCVVNCLPEQSSIELALAKAQSIQLRELAALRRHELGNRETGKLILREVLAAPSGVLGLKEFADLPDLE